MSKVAELIFHVCASFNKKAFQEDAYRLLANHILWYPMSGEEGWYPPTYPCTLDIPSPLKGTWYQRYPRPGKDMELEIPTPPVNRQTPVKTLPSRNFVCDRYKVYTCNIFCRHCCSRSLCIVLWRVCYTYEHTSLSYTIYTSPGLLPCLLQ